MSPTPAKGEVTRCTCTGNDRLMFSEEFQWPRYLSRARVLLAAVALIIASVDTGRNLPFIALLGVFLVASILAELRGKARSGMLGLLALFADTLYFLIVAYFGSPRLLWLESVFFLYLLTEALVFYGPVEVGVITAGSTIFCAVLPQQQVHLPAVELADGRTGGATGRGAEGGGEGQRGRAAADRLGFPRRAVAELHQSADAPGDSAQTARSRFRGGRAGPEATAIPGTIAGEGSARVRTQHASGGCGRRQPDRHSAADGGRIPERERHPGDVPGHQQAGGVAAGDDAGSSEH